MRNEWGDITTYFTMDEIIGDYSKQCHAYKYENLDKYHERQSTQVPIEKTHT